MTDYKKLAQQVLNDVGGKDNIADINHCATRLRLQLHDGSLVKDDEVKNIDGVVGTVLSKNNYQIIIGTDVANAYNALIKIAGNVSKNSTQSSKTKFT